MPETDFVVVLEKGPDALKVYEQPPSSRQQAEACSPHHSFLNYPGRSRSGMKAGPGGWGGAAGQQETGPAVNEGDLG